MISRQKLFTVCPDKVTTLKALKRNGYYPPRVNDAMMTIKFMSGVIQKKTWWLPCTKMMQVWICADPPSKIEIAA